MSISGGITFQQYKYVGDLPDEVITAVFNNPIKKNDGSNIKLFECDRAGSSIFGHSKDPLSWAYPHGILIGGQKYRSIFDYYIIKRFEELAPGEFDDIIQQLHTDPKMNHNKIRQALFKTIDRGRVAEWMLTRGLQHVQKATLECAKQNEAFMNALLAPDNQLPMLAYSCSFFGTALDYKLSVEWYNEFMNNNYVVRYPIHFPLKLEDLSVLPKLGKGYNVLGAVYVALRQTLYNCQTYGKGIQTLHINIEPYTDTGTVHIVNSNSSIFVRPRRPLKRRYANGPAESTNSPPQTSQTRVNDWLDTTTKNSGANNTAPERNSSDLPSPQTAFHRSPALAPREVVVRTPSSVMQRCQLGSSASMMSVYSNFEEEEIPYAATTRNSTPAKTTENNRLSRSSRRDGEELENYESNVTVQNAFVNSPLLTHGSHSNTQKTYSRTDYSAVQSYLGDFSRPPPAHVRTPQQPETSAYWAEPSSPQSHYSRATTVDVNDPPPLEPPHSGYQSPNESIALDDITPEEEEELLAGSGISDERMAELTHLLDSNPAFINNILHRESSRASSRRE